MSNANDAGSLARMAQALKQVGIELGGTPVTVQDMEIRLCAAINTAELSGLSLQRRRPAELSRLPAGEPKTHKVVVGGQETMVTKGVYDVVMEQRERLGKLYPAAK